jgi:hypothetical protein
LEKRSTKDKLLDIKFQVERFIVKKWLIFAVIFLYIQYDNGQKIETLEQTAYALIKNEKRIANSYLGLTTNGVPVDLPRNFITPDGREYEIANVLKNLLVDRATITDGFKISKFNKATDITDQSQNLQDFLREYVVVHNGKTQELIDVQNIAFNNYVAYSNYIIDLMVKNELPHYITVTGSKVDTENDFIIYDVNKFKIKVHYDTIINTFVGKDRDGKSIFEPASGVATIEADGYFDVKTTTSKDKEKKTKGLNKSGLHFKSFSVKYSISGK